MEAASEWITPFKKQCFVTLGAAISFAQFGMVMGFTAILLPQLKKPDSVIPIEDETSSWIAAIPAFSLIIGNLAVPSIMGKFGRKIANVVAVIPVLIGWIWVSAATSVTSLLVARFLQGISMGITTSLGPILVGEYTSPRNRGAFLFSVSLIMSAGTLIVHTLGTYYTWKMTALIVISITLADLLIIIYSPESPSWLADQGRYDDCARIFRWLRGNGEEDELEKMIKASKSLKESKIESNVSEKFGKRFKRNVIFVISTVRKREFYKPIFIVSTLYTYTHWGGINMLSAYTLDTFYHILGPGCNNTLLIITLDVQRLISNAIAVYIIRKLKRRTMLFITCGINIAIYLIIAGYVYAKTHNVLPFDHVLIGVLLIHIHMFSVITGSLPLPIVISGELFPLQYRSLASGMSAVACSFNIFLSVKTVYLLFNSVGFYGAYVIYAVILTYCFIVLWFTLPETKDRTLQSIEDEFRGKRSDPEDLKSAQALTTWDIQSVEE